MAKRTLYLVRHGDYLPGETEDGLGRGLSERGRRQAGHVAELLADRRLDAIHSSPAPRALETARIIAERQPGVLPQPISALFECIPAIPPTMVDLFAQDLARYPHDHVAKCRDRLDRAFARFFKPGRRAERHEVLVCHGNVIRYLITRALGVEADAWVGMDCSQASVTRVSVGTGLRRFVLESLNDVGHLPPDLRAIND